MIYDEVIKVAKEKSSNTVAVNPTSGKREYYRKLGFIKDRRNPGAPTLMVRKIRRQ